MSVNAIVNITMCGVGLFFILVFLVSLFSRKSRRDTFMPMVTMAFLEILVLGLIIFQWVIFEGGIIYPLAYKASFLLVYPLCNAVMLCILWYIRAYLKDAERVYGREQVITGGPWILRNVILSVAGSIVYLSSVFTGVFYYFADSGEEFFTEWAFVPWIFTVAMFIPEMILINKNHRIIGRARSILLTVYWIVPLVLLLFDFSFGIDIAAFSIVVFMFIMGSGLDIQIGEELLAREAQLARTEAELAESRTRLMLSQIRPHFMFNSLNVIAALCEEDPALARDATNTFAEYLRENINTIERVEPVPFSRELDHIKSYVWLEKLRFGERIKMEYDIGPMDFLIPTLTVQPVVENAIKHGVCKKEEPGTVKLSTAISKEGYVITIEDDGVGFDPKNIKDDGKSHIGIENVRRRLQMQMKGSLLIESIPGKGTKARILIPIPVKAR